MVTHYGFIHRLKRYNHILLTQGLTLGVKGLILKTLMFVYAFRCGVVLDVWMLPLGEEIFNYELDQPLLFVNSQAFHRWKGNMDPLKKLINKKPGKIIICLFYYQTFLSFFL